MKNNMLYKKLAFLGVAFSMSMLSSSLTFAKEYYKWVDSKGSTHYTTTPPPKSAKNKGKIDTYGYYSPSTQQNSNSASQSNPNQQSQAQIPVPQNQVQDQQQREANAALQQAPVERTEQLR